MGERRQLPGADVCGQEKDALAAPKRFEVVFQSLVLDDSGNVFRRELREVTELDEQAAEVSENLSDDTVALDFG